MLSRRNEGKFFAPKSLEIHVCHRIQMQERRRVGRPDPDLVGRLHLVQRRERSVGKGREETSRECSREERGEGGVAGGVGGKVRVCLGRRRGEERGEEGRGHRAAPLVKVRRGRRLDRKERRERREVGRREERGEGREIRVGKVVDHCRSGVVGRDVAPQAGRGGEGRGVDVGRRGCEEGGGEEGEDG